LLTVNSDGKTPAEQVEQILRIHSILPGQKPEKQFEIPIRNNSIQKTTSEPTVPAQQPVPQQLVPQQPAAVVEPIHLEGATTYEKTGDVKDPTNMPNLPVDRAQPQPGQLNQAQRDRVAETNPPSKLLHSNPAAEPHRNDRLRRLDSETQEDDEFHDAQS
jgi:hypothetical protein